MTVAPAGQRPVLRSPHCLAGAMAAVLVAAAGCTAGGKVPASDATTATSTLAGAPATTGVAPQRLQGRPLTGPTGLRLLVSSDPPRLLDVDRGTSRRVGGLPENSDSPGFWVAGLGQDALIGSDTGLFRLRRGTATAEPIARATWAVPSRDGRGVWLQRHGKRCSLQEVGLDGRPRRPARRIGCTTTLQADTSLGLLVGTEDADGLGTEGAILDRGSLRVLVRHPEIHAVVGDLVFWGGHERNAGRFTLTDRRTGARYPIQRPTPFGYAGAGLASPDGRFLAVEFADASWSRAKGQISDVWLLELRTRRWRQLPGMPLLAPLKSTAMTWTGDGRLVLAGEFDGVGGALAVWRPGQDQLAVRRLALPSDRAGSDSLVAWPAPGA